MAPSRSPRVLLVLSFLVVAPLTGCTEGGNGDTPTPNPTPGTPTGTAPSPTVPATPTAPAVVTPTLPTWEKGPTLFVGRNGPAASGPVAIGHLNDDENFDAYAAGKLFLGQAGGTFEAAGEASGADCACAMSSAAIGDVNEDGANDLVVAAADGLRLYVNNGEAIFVEAAADRGLDGAKGASVALADVENDGDLDVAVAAPGKPFRVYKNDGSGVFSVPESVATATGSAFTFLFLDDDTFFDLVMVTDGGLRLYNFDNATKSYKDLTSTAKFPAAYVPANVYAFDYDNDQGVDLLASGPTGVKLLRNTHRKAFEDRTTELGLGGVSGRAALALDYDNDGWPDVALATATGPRLFRNEDGERFRDATGTGLTGDHAAIASGDFDRDGRLDLLAFGGGASTLFVNRADAGPYFTLHLRGNESNSAGVGVKVTLSSGTFIMFRQTGGGGSPGVAEPIDPHFGLGKDLAPKYTLAIKWPSNILQFENIEKERVVNRQLQARESAEEAPWAEC